MRAMATDRRGFLTLLGGGLLALGCPATASGQAPELFAAARRERGGGYSAAIFDLAGNDVATVPLPGRGHDIAVRPGVRECVAFARRPGTFAVAFSPDRASPLPFTAAKGRHFYGHGAFSRDGRLLYTTENDFDAAAGIIGVRDAGQGYRLVGEYPSGAVGPHDIALLSDGRTLVVANGGIETHPDFGRHPLNLATMQPSLAYIDRETGDMLERVMLPAAYHQLSIRHLAVAGRDTVVFGAQYMGPRADRPPLLGVHRRGEAIRLIELPEETYALLRNYVSSIEADAVGMHVAATSSKGDVALIIDIAAARCIEIHRIADVSGVARRNRGFLATSGSGALTPLAGGTTGPAIVTPAAWDNHAVRLQAIRK